MKKRKGALLLSVMLLFLGIFSAAGASAHTAAAGTSQNTERTTAHSRVSEQESENTDMAVHFLDVGQGLSILVQSGGQNLLYDGGDRSASSFVVSYLKKQNVETIDYLIASHYDSDHISGLVGCLNAFETKQVIGPDYQQDSSIYRSFQKAVSKEGLRIRHPKPGNSYSFGTGSFTILAPEEIGSNDNDNSIVIRLENGDSSFLFTGDAEADSEKTMCQSDLELECDVLCLGHHGSATATSWDFLRETVPEYAVISCGTGNSYGHPHKDTMDKLQDMEIPVFRTDLQGTVIAVSDGEDITWDQEPCNDYSPSEDSDQGTVPSSASQKTAASTPVPAAPEPAQDTVDTMVWLSATGSKYHRIPDCGNMNPDTARQISRSEAESQGYEPCKKCF